MNKLPFYRIRPLIFLILVAALLGFASMSEAQSVQSWSEPVNLSVSGSASNPSIIVDGRGILHALWADEFDGYKYTQSTDGVTWTAPETTKFPFSAETPPPVFLTDARGVIHIFWRGARNELFYAQSLGENLGSPSSWRINTRLDDSVFDFDASLDVQGQLHMAYVKNPETGSAGIFYRGSRDGGISWGGVAPLFESPYFRSVTAEGARVRVATSETPDEQNVYVVWDDRPQKRIFMGVSSDGGSNWAAIKEMITPQASLGFRTPYHADIDTLGEKVLLTWQVGEPGVRCTPYSQSSSDGGETWGEPVKILPESAQCPERSEFIDMDPLYSTVLFTIQGDLSIHAWDGSVWSNPEVQTGPSAISNPATFDTVLLGCKQAVAHNDQLYVIGCDEGAGRDIWFVARQLDPLDELFPMPAKWGGDANVAAVSQAISSVSSIRDQVNNTHVLWVQSAASPTDPFEPRIEYARWNGKEWTKAAPVLTELGGLPRNLTLQIDSNQRLLLSWVNQDTGDLMFTWANSARANIPLEWMQPIILTSASRLVDSPDMLVDASGRIVIAYAITLNEERGIYVIQSTDLGETWSPSVKVFDAVQADWDRVDQPRLAVSEDGRLHMLFAKYALAGDPQPMGLYYSNSTNGGTTWAPPEVVNEQPVQWSSIVGYKGTLHRFWQEKNRAAISTYHQSSSDGGVTWSTAAKISSDANIISTPAVSVDPAGKAHLLQMIQQEDLQTLQEWAWDGGRWQLLETRKLSLPEQDYPVALESGITSEGMIYTLLPFQKPLPDESIQTVLLHISRSLELEQADEPVLVFISTPSASGRPTEISTLETQPAPTSPLANLDNTRPTVNKNLVGLFLIVAVIFLILLFTVPKRNKAADETRPPK